MTLANMESSELPQETESSEVQETVESPEVQEEAQQLEQATFEPEATVELEKSHQEAETVETAFTETMQAAETSAELPVSEVERPDPGGDGSKEGPQAGAGSAGLGGFKDGEMPRSGESPEKGGAEMGVTAEDDWEAPVAAEGIKPEALRSPEEVSMDGKGGDRVAIGTWPTPEDDLDGVAIIDSNDGPREAVDNNPRLGDDRVKIDTVPLPEDGLDGVAIIDSNDGPREAVDNNPRLGDDRVKIDTVPLPEDGLDGVAIIDSNDGSREAVDNNPRLGDDRVKIDTVPLPEDGLDGVAIIDSNDGPRIDPMKAGMDDPLRDDLRMAEQGYLGEMTAPKGGEIPETGVGDLMDGIEGALDGAPGKVDDPFDSTPEWGETADGQSLADAAAPGADTRAGISTLRSITGKIWGAITKDSGNDKGGGGGGVRGTPTPDTVEGSFEDPLGVMDIKETTPKDHAESMMQPVDDEGQGREQPGMKMSAEELRDAQLNPYIQNTDEHVDVLPGSRDDMTDPKDFLIDNDLEPFAPGAGGGTNPLAKPSTNDDAPPPPPPSGGKPGTGMEMGMDDRVGVVDFGDDTIEGNNGPREGMVSSKPPDGGDGKPPDGADQVFKPSTNDGAPPPPPPGGGKPGVSMD